MSGVQISLPRPISLVHSTRINSADSRDSLNHRSLAINGDCSSAGRALDCDSGGRGFEPRQSPHFSGIYTGHRNDAFTSLPADLKPFSSSLENLQFKCIKLIKPASNDKLAKGSILSIAEIA